MHETQHFAVLLLAVAGAGLVAVLSQRLTDLLRVPAPAVFLVVAAVAARVISPVHAPPRTVVADIVTVALIVILFDGGRQLGWTRFRAAAPRIVTLGVVGTVLTAGAAGLLVHLAFGLGWYLALLVGTAVAPTDPAVVFSVLGRRTVAGPTGTLLAGESGANDPVGIALMVSLLAAGHLGAGTAGAVAGRFAEQMAIGAAVGLVAGAVLLAATRRVALPGDGLYALLVLAGIAVVYAAATLAHGSGFLAVFAVGIAFGDARVPHQLEIARFHDTLAGLGEIVAFLVLGLTVDVGLLAHRDVWLPGMVLGVALAVVIRPVCAGVCLLGSPLRAAERTFVLLVGLKGAVPILLASMLLGSGLAQARRCYLIVVVVVLVSVVVQGGLVPALARRLGVAEASPPGQSTA